MSWYTTNDIEKIQIELTSYCNAACEMCARHDAKADEIHKHFLNSDVISLETIKSQFKRGEWASLKKVIMCGNIDEPTLHPDMINIVRYFLTLNDEARVHIASNGGTRNDQFWIDLASLAPDRITVKWGIDGLEDTNHLYRKKVKWERLQRNFRKFIEYGGSAEWQFITFDWNKHQVAEARERANAEGFGTFKIIRTIRE
jgi:MoaA/NifB/PqqE/SkfB family radical SAM enzyme